MSCNYYNDGHDGESRKDTCKNCVHWGFRKMIQKPYGYTGDIPCLRCSRYSESQDLYEPKQEIK